MPFYHRMPTPNPRSHRSSLIWLPLALLAAVLILRVLRQHGVFASTQNLSPLMALAFTGAIVFPKTIKWWAWALILPVVDVLSLGIMSQIQPEAVVACGCFAVAAWWGGRLRGRAGVLDALAGTVICSVLFYVVTNTVSWIGEPAYAKNLSGWVQALTVGIPGPYPSTLAFFRNSLIADILGSTVLLVVYNAEAVLRKLRAMPLIGWQAGDSALA
jgi:branched-subunit amino acid transport protein